MKEELLEALLRLDLKRAEALLADGADINAVIAGDGSLLGEIIAQIDDPEARRCVVAYMLDHGADPCVIPADGAGPLFCAVIQHDTEVLRLLLDHGADPNQEYDLGESLYSYAEFDYRYETYDGLELPEGVDDAAKLSENGWLLFLDHMAVKHAKRRPDYLFLLREYGALTSTERGSGSRSTPGSGLAS